MIWSIARPFQSKINNYTNSKKLFQKNGLNQTLTELCKSWKKGIPFRARTDRIKGWAPLRTSRIHFSKLDYSKRKIRISISRWWGSLVRSVQKSTLCKASMNLNQFLNKAKRAESRRLWPSTPPVPKWPRKKRRPTLRKMRILSRLNPPKILNRYQTRNWCLKIKGNLMLLKMTRTLGKFASNVLSFTI